MAPTLEILVWFDTDALQRTILCAIKCQWIESYTCIRTKQFKLELFGATAKNSKSIRQFRFQNR